MDIEKLRDKWGGHSCEGLLDRAIGEFAGKIAFATSFGAEDQVLTDMLCKLDKEIVIFTLDTGLLHKETYQVLEKTQQRYGCQIKVLSPDYQSVEEMVAQYGERLYYESLELRKLCCKTRKIDPLRNLLIGFNAWICGLRAEQSPTRDSLQEVQWDASFSLVKINPLLDWSNEKVWQYIRDNDVPYNSLHEKGYPSIGCEPCTRAIREGEDIRAGRWWWENAEQKECGLHLGNRKQE